MPKDITILVVEDNPALQKLMKLSMRQLGFDCLVVGSGEEAVQHHLEQPVDLIFMDIGLPGIQGDGATMLIRQAEHSEKRKRVPIVALTGHANKEHCLKAGMDDYLQKPALMQDLKNIINKHIPSVFLD